MNKVADLTLLIIKSLRPFFGTRGVCIFPITCIHYSSHQLATRNIFIALFLIIIRVLACNPLTAFVVLLGNRYLVRQKNY